MLAYARQILVRPGAQLLVNGEVVPVRQPLHVFVDDLPTEVAGADGVLRRTVRRTEIAVYEPRKGEVASLFELGLPVVETGDRWHYNVAQKVPLNMERDNVTPAYLRNLRVAVFNVMSDRITPEDTTSTWVQVAADDVKCSDTAASRFLAAKYGEKSVAFDPGNPEANAMAVANGFTLIPARGLSAGQRRNLYNAGKLLSSSKAFPKAGRGAYSDDPDATPVTVVPREDWSDSMDRLYDYTVGVASRLLGRLVDVRFVDCRSFVGQPWSACYGHGRLDYNVYRIGREWFKDGATEAVDDLLIHELAHEFESNHLSERYYAACTKLGARLKAAALKDPKWFLSFAVERPTA